MITCLSADTYWRYPLRMPIRRPTRTALMRRQFWRAGALCCGMLLFMSGCAQRDNHQTPLSPRGSAADDVITNAIWPFWPTSMSIHPLTRVTTEEQTGRTILEARIEFLDSQGNRSKAVGQMTLALYNANNRSEAIHVWAQDLLDPTRNQQHFDVVTRTYLLRLELDNPQFPEDAELRASFNSVDGQSMEADYRFKRPALTSPQ
jgi:hypothetical protein